MQEPPLLVFTPFSCGCYGWPLELMEGMSPRLLTFSFHNSSQQSEKTKGNVRQTHHGRQHSRSTACSSLEGLSFIHSVASRTDTSQTSRGKNCRIRHNENVEEMTLSHSSARGAWLSHTSQAHIVFMQHKEVMK